MLRFNSLALLLFLFFATSVFAQQPNADEEKIIMPACPDWVNPTVRKDYPGYAILKQRKKNSPSWKHMTNRARGNIRGGGTTLYYDYKPFYISPKRRSVSWKRRTWKRRI